MIVKLHTTIRELDGNATENGVRKTNFTFLKLLRYYPNKFKDGSICIMWTNHLRAESVRTVFQFRQRKENSLSCVHFLQKEFEFGDFPLLFCRERQRNIPKCEMHVSCSESVFHRGTGY